MATRDPIDLCDPDTGEIQTDDLREIPERMRRAIDGIKQKVRTYRNPAGEEVREVETELKLCSKVASVDMLMKHLSLYAAEKHAHEITADWDAMLSAKPVAPAEDPVEARILEVSATNPTPQKPVKKPVRKISYTVDELIDLPE